MKTEVKGNQLIITIDLDEPRVSATGKSLVVSSSGGFKKTDAKVKGKAVSVNVTAIIPLSD